jgi:hypothetical protein
MVFPTATPPVSPTTKGDGRYRVPSSSATCCSCWRRPAAAATWAGQREVVGADAQRRVDGRHVAGHVGHRAISDGAASSPIGSQMLRQSSPSNSI